MNTTASTIGEFIRYNSCERRFKLNSDLQISQSIPFWDRLNNPLNIVLAQTGKDKELAWKQTLDKAKLVEIQPDQNQHGKVTTSWSGFLKRLSTIQPAQPAYAREVEIKGQVGLFDINGQIDFLLLLWRDGQPILRIVECKASRKDATYQTVQVAIYQKLVQQLLGDEVLAISGIPLKIGQIECVVARIDDATNTIQDILRLLPLDTSRELVDIDRLLAENGKLDRITKTNLSDIAFQLEPQCDSCIFNIHCLAESARERRIEIIGVNSSVIRTLKTNGIHTIDQLAMLDPESSTANNLRNDNGFTIRIETLIAKAKTRRKNLPGGANASKDDYEVDSYDHRVQSQLPISVLDIEGIT